MSMASPNSSTYYPHGLTCLSPDTTLESTVQRLGSTLTVGPLDVESRYMRPKRISYQINGHQRTWDMVEAMPSVGIVLYHSDLNAWIIVRQFRPTVYANKLRQAQQAGLPAPSYAVGFTHELCAGLIDKAESLVQICKEEIAEECGFDVPVESISPIATTLQATGSQGSEHYMYFAQVDDSMRLSTGGGGIAAEGESIEVLALPLEQTDAFLLDDAYGKSAGLMFGLVWAYHALRAGKIGKMKGSLMTSALELQPVLPA